MTLAMIAGMFALTGIDTSASDACLVTLPNGGQEG